MEPLGLEPVTDLLTEPAIVPDELFSIEDAIAVPPVVSRTEEREHLPHVAPESDEMTLDCANRTTREINVWLRGHAAAVLNGESRRVTLLNPDSRHNIAVGLMAPLEITIDGPVGYYCAGLCDGVVVTIRGGAGWGLGENLMSGRVTLHGSAGSSAGATMHGGTIVVHGDAGARCGAAMKGGTLFITGSIGVMSGFMMQKGVMIIGGDAGDALGDSLYEGVIYLRGQAESFGADAHEVPMLESDFALLAQAFAEANVDFSPVDFRKVESARQLYNFNTKEKEIWKQAL